MRPFVIGNDTNFYVGWEGSNSIVSIMFIQGNIYAQIFNHNAIKLGNNIRINTFIPRKENREPDIEYINKELRISRLYWDEPNQRYITQVNQWKFDPVFSGEMISSVFDASPSFYRIFYSSSEI